MSESGRIRLSEAARRLGMTIYTLRRWARRGVVPYFLVGPGQYMEFDPKDIEALAYSMRHERRTPPVE